MKFRNFIHISLALLVLVSNTGLAINVHYCGEVIAAISVESLKKNNSSGCCGDKREVEDSCCKDKKVEIKESTSEKILIKSIQFESSVFITKERFELVFNERIVNGVMVNNLPAYHCNTHAPPFYKLYSRLLFYA